MVIYKITNLINGKLYIGQTTRSIQTRFNGHMSDMRKNKTTPICNALRLYGKDNFQIEVIAMASTKEELNRLERFYIQEFNSLKPSGYNIEIGGSNVFISSKGIKQSQDWIEKRTAPRRTPVTGKNLKTDEIIEFESMAAACRFIGQPSNSATCISKVCNKEQHFAFGYYWKYSSDKEFPFYEKRMGRTKAQPLKHKPVKRIDSNNNIKIYPSLSHTMSEGFDPSTIVKVCKGKLRSHRGFRWAYIPENEGVVNE